MKHQFKLIATEKGTHARAGEITTPKGKIETPVFMPVGTLGAIKGVHWDDIKRFVDAQIVLANAYHLYLRPGVDTIEAAGGLHSFNAWDRHILTDSGGYQVFSLAANRKIKEEGVYFQSHIDGSKHLFSPENNMELQLKIGADFIMAFDECAPYPADYAYTQNSMELTHRWWKRCLSTYQREKENLNPNALLIPIVQGGFHKDLRTKSAQFMAKDELPINAIGGLSVGEPTELLYEMTSLTTQHLPESSARYLMGVGKPWNLLECIDRGIDMFDCVLPARNARHGIVYTHTGVINLKNQKWKNDFSPLESGASDFLPHRCTKAYLSHLIKSNELLGMQLATLHNLAFYADLMREARVHIQQGDFKEWKAEKVAQIAVKR